MMITQAEIKNIVKIIAETENPDQIILFGSYANDSANEDSDLDLLIVKDSQVETNKRCLEIRKKLRGSKIPIDLVMYTKEEIESWKDTKGSFISQLLATGKVIYG